MANVATAGSPLPIGFKHSGMGSFVVPVICTFDTTASDLTIYTPSDADAFCALVGLQYAETSAHSLTVKSGSTTLVTYEMPASSGRDCPIGNGLTLSSLVKGEALKLSCGTAVISTLLAYVLEYKQIQFG